MFINGQVAEAYFDFSLADDDFLGNGFNDIALVIGVKVGPVTVQILGFRGNLFSRERVHLSNVDFGLEARKVGLKLLGSFIKGLVEFAKAGAIELPILVEAIDSIDFSLNFLTFGALDFEQTLFFLQRLVGILQIRLNPVG